MPKNEPTDEEMEQAEMDAGFAHGALLDFMSTMYDYLDRADQSNLDQVRILTEQFGLGLGRNWLSVNASEAVSQ